MLVALAAIHYLDSQALMSESVTDEGLGLPPHTANAVTIQKGIEEYVSNGLRWPPTSAQLHHFIDLLGVAHVKTDVHQGVAAGSS